jgi:hypothetical protein
MCYEFVFSCNQIWMSSFFLSLIPRFNLIQSIILGLIKCQCEKLDFHLEFIWILLEWIQI